MNETMRPGLVAEIGHRIRETRRATGLTVVGLAERSGVSRRMLTQIELGQANPSIATLDRVADGLGTTFAALVGVSTAAAVPDGVRVWSTPAGSWAYLLSAVDTDHYSIELWRTRLVGDDRSDVLGRPRAPDIMHHVIEGRLGISQDHGEEAVVEPGDSLRTSGETRRRYRSHAPGGTTFIRVVTLPRPN